MVFSRRRNTDRGEDKARSYHFNYDRLAKLKQKYFTWVTSRPLCTALIIKKNSNSDWSLCVLHKKGLTSKEKREIIWELGDIPLMFEISDV